MLKRLKGVIQMSYIETEMNALMEELKLGTIVTEVVQVMGACSTKCIM